MSAKGNRCIEIVSHDPTSIFFWSLIIILFILVIGNFILTLSIISFFKIGLGMESIEIVPESKTIKFFGTADFHKVYKKDGFIESFRDIPTVITSDDSEIKFNVIDRKGQVHNRLSMSDDGIEIKAANHMTIRDPNTNSPIFTTNPKIISNFNKPAKKLVTNAIHVSEIISPVDQDLQIKSINTFLRGIEGTLIDGKEVHLSAHDNLSLKSLNNSVQLKAAGGIYLYFDKLPITTRNNEANRLQNKIFACYNKLSMEYTLLQVKATNDVHEMRYKKC